MSKATLYFQVVVKGGPALNGSLLTNVTVSAASPSLLLTNLTAGLMYVVQAAAVTRVGAGPYSSPASLRLDPYSRLLNNYRWVMELYLRRYKKIFFLFCSYSLPSFVYFGS